jgi:hypothetical protein
MEKTQLVQALEQIGFTVEILPNKIIAKKQGYSMYFHNNCEIGYIFKELMKAGETLKMWEIHRVLQIVH